jgi:hypothetical protein
VEPLTLSELSLGEGIRTLEVQERSVDQLRARTGMLLAASSLSASFLGAQTIQHESGLGALSAIALVLLIVSVGLCVYLLLGKQGFVFSISGREIYESLFAFQDDAEETRRRLVYWIEAFWTANQAKIENLSRYFLVASIALVLQLIFWAFALASNIS